jgi:alpha/beta superfamily hydrolase
MHNGVVTAITRALATQGVIALRFNFRGVGRSEGQYDEGQGELSDVAGALDWMLAQPQIDPWRVSLVGYSFGAWVGLAYAQTDPRTAAVAAVGLPAWIYDADFAQQNTPPKLGAGGPWQFDPTFMQSFIRPRLFVTGEYDPFAPPQALSRFVERLPPPKTLHIVPGSDHFLQGREREVGDLVAGFVASL